jgi:hypothetical protein
MPQVIISNYVMGRVNCLEASSLHALCCSNECEDLLGHLEQEIAAPEADPDQIAKLVSALPSDTIQAPRNLSSTLLDRLASISASNGGRVSLHGRLFAQWMHHAFPRECPYPHEAGTTSPQTPSEWMAATGQEDSAASQEEMESCIAEPGHGAEESTELPWSDTEELLHSHTHSPAVQAQASAANAAGGFGLPSFTGTILPLFLSAGLAWVFILDHTRKTQECRYAALSDEGRMTLLVASLALAAYALDFVDRTVFVLALLAGPAVRGACFYMRKSQRQKNQQLQKRSQWEKEVLPF